MATDRSEKLESELATFFERKMEIDRLREKHKLLPLNLVEDKASEIRDRVIVYQRELEAKVDSWRLEDESKKQS